MLDPSFSWGCKICWQHSEQTTRDENNDKTGASLAYPTVTASWAREWDPALAVGDTHIHSDSCTVDLQLVLCSIAHKLFWYGLDLWCCRRQGKLYTEKPIFCFVSINYLFTLQNKCLMARCVIVSHVKIAKDETSAAHPCLVYKVGRAKGWSCPARGRG